MEPIDSKHSHLLVAHHVYRCSHDFLQNGLVPHKVSSLEPQLLSTPSPKRPLQQQQQQHYKDPSSSFYAIGCPPLAPRPVRAAALRQHTQPLIHTRDTK